jgi:hypothetical protein
MPRITGSKAFADDGMLVVLFDGGGLPETAEPPAVGALVISRFARTGAQTDAPYDHLSLLRTIAGTFGVDPPGAAAGDEVEPLGHDVLRSQDVLNSDTDR